MRRARATAPFAALALLLAGCADGGQGTDEPARGETASVAESQRAPAEVSPTIEVDGDVARVRVGDTAWRLEVLEAGPVGLESLAMFDGSPTEPPAEGSHVVWVCMEATQLSGEPGAWLSDGVRVEVWAADDGSRYDDLTGFDYEPTGSALDVYEASGNAIDDPYERVCPIFVVPTDVDGSTIALVPNGGEPVVLER